MNVHVFFSMFISDGAAFGKADFDTESTEIPAIGDCVELSALATPLETTGESIGLTVIGVERHSDYVGVELADLVAPDRSAAGSIFSRLTAMGFNCDAWGR